MPTLAALEAAVCERPDHDRAWTALATAYANLQRLDDALPCGERARTLNPRSAEHWGACAAMLGRLGRMDEARAHYEQALRLAPASARLHAALGKLLFEAALDEVRAEEVLTRAVLIDPGQTGACARLAQIALTRMSHDEAIGYLDRAFDGCVHPNRVRAALGGALLETGRYEPARTYLQACVDRADEDPESERGTLLLNLAEAQVCLGDMDAALETCARAVSVAPMSGRGFVVYVEQLIRLDRLDEAMRVSRIRARSGLPFGAFRRVGTDSAHPVWRGEPLERRTVLLRAEAGCGDAVQFARFASLYREAGATVVIETFPALVRLLQTLDGADLVVTPYDEMPPIDYDLHPALAALLLPWTWPSMAARIPYLHLPAAGWRDRRGRALDAPGLRIGLTWRGASFYHERDAHRRRGVPLAMFAPLANLPGVTLYSLQVGPGTEEIATAPFPMTPLDLDDFHHTAAAIQALDLIVSIDTGTAHLAGALGKPCLVLMPFRACWRWMLDRDTSPFYPSLRLFRQSTPGDWTPVVDAVVNVVVRMSLRDVGIR